MGRNAGTKVRMDRALCEAMERVLDHTLNWVGN